MDINCTNSCSYQSNGKCTLHNLPKNAQITNAFSSGIAADVDCLHYNSMRN